MEALQQATGLSQSVLVHALTPLISEKGILTSEGFNQHLQKGEFAKFPVLYWSAIYSLFCVLILMKYVLIIFSVFVVTL